jgi:TonB family protein
MKTIMAVFMLGLLAIVPLQAAFESIKIEMTVEPQMPAVLRMDGLRDGRVIMAIDVDATGRLSDCLVIAASHKELVRSCVEALKEWRFTPARLDGQPISARQELTIHLSQTGAVVSRTATETITDLFERVAGRRNDYEMCPAREVDRPLTAVNRVSPEYARDAEKLGVGGRVRVHFYVDEQGNVRLPAVPAETDPYLSAVAVQAMRSWKFDPPTRRGQPVLVAAVQEFDFGGAR